MALPVPAWGDLAFSGRKETVSVPGQVYLASPFFTLGERWVVEEALRGLQELGLKVFSPFHEIGPGIANVVAPADIAGIDASDRVFAVLDGTDSGTLFEVGYAVAKGIPVYAVAQNVSDEDLKMVQGSGCRVYSDFVTALHHTAWKL
jgi:nucleoside 2-deoxyribosyltransferase